MRRRSSKKESCSVGLVDEARPLLLLGAAADWLLSFSFCCGGGIKFAAADIEGGCFLVLFVPRTWASWHLRSKHSFLVIDEGHILG